MRLLIGLVLAMFLFAHGASAHHNKQHKGFVIGEKMSVATLGCDEEEQLHEILVAQMDSWEKGWARLVFYRMMRGEAGHPVCNIGQMIGLILIRRVAGYEGLYFPDGKKDGYMLEVKYPNADWSFFIYSDYDAVEKGDGI